jgi:GntR family transcriptional regulator
LLLQGERQKFLTDEWPRIRETIQRLGLKPEQLLNGDGPAQSSSDAAPQKTDDSNPPGSNPTKKEER